MAFSGNDLLSALADDIQQFTNSGTEQTRALRHLNRGRRRLQSKLWTIAGNYLLTSATFPTVESRSPNTYTISTVNSNALAAFGKLEYMERVISDANHDYERIHPIFSLADKDFVTAVCRAWLLGSSVDAEGAPRGYFLGNDFIQLEPISDDTYTIRVHFHELLTTIAASATDMYDYPDSSFDYLVYYAGIHERLSRNMVIGDLVALRDRALIECITEADERILDGPSTTEYMEDLEDYC